ncbi:MAG: translation initiation factor IF-3 [Chloroflexi bacterium]|nr:translation initiation factor IF-3 [Chloroflexota bacterium]
MLKIGGFALSYQDRTITCSDCGKPFVFTAGEQAFYAEKGFGTGPKRCKQCRDARRAEREGGVRPSYGGGPSGPRPSTGYGGAPSGPRPAGPGGPSMRPATSGPSGPRPGGPVPFMRGRGGPRPVLPVEEPYRVNQRIRVPEVRVIVEDDDGEEENLGVMPTYQALKLAEERDLDLVEVAPNARPPVCKIMDYGRFKYVTERKNREAHRAGRAGKAASDMKDVQISPRIGAHDMEFKIDRAEDFLAQGHPVRLVVRFLGRDMRHPEVGMKALQDALEALGQKVPITVDQQPRMEGRQLFALVRLAKGTGAKAGEKKLAAEKSPAVAAPTDTVVAPSEQPVEVAPAAAEAEPARAEPVPAAR